MSMDIPRTKEEWEEYERLCEKYSKPIREGDYYVEVSYS